MNKEDLQYKIYTQLKAYAEEYNTEKIDFTNNKSKYFITYDYKENAVKIYTTFDIIMMNQIYFTSRGICERAITEIGIDNIKKLFD